MSEFCCSTEEPTEEQLKQIENDLNTKSKSLSKTFTSEETIPFNIVYHICYDTTGDDESAIEADCVHATELINRAFNLDLESDPQVKPEGFDSGRDVYHIDITEPLPTVYTESRLQSKIRSEKRRLRRIIVNNHRRRRSKIRERNELRRERPRPRARIKKLNKQINNLERRNAGRIKENRKKAKQLTRQNNKNKVKKQKLLTQYGGQQRYDNFNRYNKYVSIAGKANIQFTYLKKVIEPLNTINVDDEKQHDIDIKINGSPKSEEDKSKSIMHVWVVDFQNNNPNGYATFPQYYETAPELDGIVVGAHRFQQSHENYATNNAGNNGKTLVHETGHWLGLLHTFHLPNDGVDDTPRQNTASSGNSYELNPEWPFSKYGRIRTSYHMFMNYMDFGKDICAFMFTRKQCIRMRDHINLYRID